MFLYPQNGLTMLLVVKFFCFVVNVKRNLQKMTGKVLSQEAKRNIEIVTPEAYSRKYILISIKKRPTFALIIS